MHLPKLTTAAQRPDMTSREGEGAAGGQLHIPLVSTFSVGIWLSDCDKLAVEWIEEREDRLE